MNFISRRLNTAEKVFYDTFPPKWNTSLVSAMIENQITRDTAKKLLKTLCDAHMSHVYKAAYVVQSLDLHLTDDQREAIFYLHLAEYYKNDHPIEKIKSINIT